MPDPIVEANRDVGHATAPDRVGGDGVEQDSIDGQRQILGQRLLQTGLHVGGRAFQHLARHRAKAGSFFARRTKWAARAASS